jgi:hypothetical protein
MFSTQFWNGSLFLRPNFGMEACFCDPNFSVVAMPNPNLTSTEVAKGRWQAARALQQWQQQQQCVSLGLFFH